MFTVMLTDGNNTPVTGTYSYTGDSIENVTAPASGSITFDVNGKANFELSHGQSITISGLPAGTNYNVTESNYDGYFVTTIGGSVGTIQKDTVSEVAFQNYKSNGGGGGDDKENITVKKEWKLDNGGTAADFVTIALLQDGKPYQTVLLNEENGWEYTWYGLDSRYLWTVGELGNTEGFTSSIVQEGNTFIIVNDDINPKDPPDPVNPVDPSDPQNPDDPSDPSDTDKTENLPPKTGDGSNLTLWFALLGISLLGLIMIWRIEKKIRYKPRHLK